MKLKLKLDDLLVDTFQTMPLQKAKGTVFGEQCTCYTQCTCPGCPTCAASCNGTCDASCNGTCASCAASCNGSCDATCDWTCGYTCGASCGGSCPTAEPYPCREWCPVE
jgi:hypothetical protein